jgi:hypothetical protein
VWQITGALPVAWMNEVSQYAYQQRVLLHSSPTSPLSSLGMPLTSPVELTFFTRLLHESRLTQEFRTAAAAYKPELVATSVVVLFATARSAENGACASHTDDSELTMNICVECADLEGGQLQFPADEAGPVVRVAHEAGQILLFPGRIGHEVAPVVRGKRANLIVFFKATAGMASAGMPASASVEAPTTSFAEATADSRALRIPTTEEVAAVDFKGLLAKTADAIILSPIIALCPDHRAFLQLISFLFYHTALPIEDIDPAAPVEDDSYRKRKTLDGQSKLYEVITQRRPETLIQSSPHGIVLLVVLLDTESLAHAEAQIELVRQHSPLHYLPIMVIGFLPISATSGRKQTAATMEHFATTMGTVGYFEVAMDNPAAADETLDQAGRIVMLWQYYLRTVVFGDGGPSLTDRQLNAIPGIALAHRGATRGNQRCLLA